MKKYLIGVDDMELRDCDVAVVHAENKGEALEKYIFHIAIKDDYFSKDVYDVCRNMCYAEKLYVDDNGQYLFDEYGNPSYSSEEIDEFFIYNIKKLFKDNEEWYNLYLANLESEGEDENIIFPDEMLAHMYKKGGNSDALFCKEIGNEIPVLT